MSPSASAFLLRAFESKPPDHGVFAKAGTNAVNRVFGLDCPVVDEIAGIGLIRRCERTYADAEEAEFGAQVQQSEQRFVIILLRRAGQGASTAILAGKASPGGPSAAPAWPLVCVLRLAGYLKAVHSRNVS